MLSRKVRDILIGYELCSKTPITWFRVKWEIFSQATSYVPKAYYMLSRKVRDILTGYELCSKTPITCLRVKWEIFSQATSYVPKRLLHAFA